MSTFEYSITAIAMIFLGISKAGFGGGAGLLATPMLALVLPTHIAVGALLPLLIVCDWVGVYFYRNDFLWKPIQYFLPGALVGIIVAIFVIGKVDDHLLRVMLGAVALGFCAFQYFREQILKLNEAKEPCWPSGGSLGFLAGIFSTVAHAAGPVATMYFIPMKLSPSQFVATMVICFTFINLMKLPFFVGSGLINDTTLVVSLILAPFAALGACIGVALNRRFSDNVFTKIVYTILFLTGLELITGKSLLRSLWGFVS